MQTNRKNINPSRVDDKRTNFLTVRLVAAASSAHPTKYAQNKCAGIQDGTTFWITAVRLKVEENQLVDVFGEIGVLVDGLKGA